MSMFGFVSEWKGQPEKQSGRLIQISLGVTMKATWTYSDASAWSDADIIGYDVEATDGSIGKIDESSADAGSAYRRRRHGLLDLR